MKKIIGLIFIAFATVCYSCYDDTVEMGGVSDDVEIKGLTGIDCISNHTDCYVIYCDSDRVSITVNGEKLEYILEEDKTMKEYKKTCLKFIRIKPFLVITYDDCPAQDWDVYEIHKLYTPIVPAEIAINLNAHALSLEKIKEMVGIGGWEVSNHGFTHSRMETVSLQQVHKAGTEKIYGWFTHTFQNGNEIFIGDESYGILSHGNDEKGQYFNIKPTLAKDYNKGTKIRLSDAQLEKELISGVSDFESKTGIKIKHFVYPYTVYDDRTVERISKYYASSRAYNGYINDVKNLKNPGLNAFPFENKFYLNSANYICYYNELEIDGILSNVKKNNLMAIQFAHTWANDFSLDKLKYLIDKAQELDIEITTRSKIWEYYEL